MTENPLRGQVAFPLFEGQPGYEMIPAGETCLRFRNSDLIALKNIYKPDGKQFIVRYNVDRDGMTTGTDATTYRQILMAALQQNDEEAILACFDHGLKVADGRTRFRLTADQKDDMPFVLSDAVPYIHRALFLAWFGKTAEEIAAETAAIVEATLDQAEAEGLNSPPEMSSSGSSTSPAEPESFQTLSGN